MVWHCVRMLRFSKYIMLRLQLNTDVINLGRTQMVLLVLVVVVVGDELAGREIDKGENTKQLDVKMTGEEVIRDTQVRRDLPEDGHNPEEEQSSLMKCPHNYHTASFPRGFRCQEARMR